MVADAGLCQDHVRLQLATAARSKKQKPVTMLPALGPSTLLSLLFLTHQLTSFWGHVPKTECDLE